MPMSIVAVTGASGFVGSAVVRALIAAGRSVRAIVEAARERFLTDVYGSTTIASIAADANASPDTVYKTFGGKAGLLRVICEEALAGEGPLPAEARSDAMQAAEADPRRLLRGLGLLTTEVAPRIAPLLLLLSTAAENDDTLVNLKNDLEAARLARMAHVAQGLANKTRFRDGRSVVEAADIMWTYSSPELFRLLVIGRGWTAQEYGRFIGESLVDALLERDPSDDPPGALH